MPHFLGNRLTGGDKIASLTLQLRSTLQKHIMVLIYVIGSVNPWGVVKLEELSKLLKFNYLIKSRTRDLPACGLVSQPVLYSIRYRKYRTQYQLTTLLSECYILMNTQKPLL